MTQDILNKWQCIVDLTKQSLSETERRTLAKTSVRYIVRWLSEHVAENEQESLKIAELFRLYQSIRHHDYVMTPKESDIFLTFAEELIRKIEVFRKNTFFE